MNRTIPLTAAADIESTDTGFLISEGDESVHLTDLLAERFVINVLGSQRRAARMLEADEADEAAS